jgi:uncharacterized protein with von Willebrand factor type A (vWA) domain
MAALYNCLNPVVPKNFGADETRQELLSQCTQYYLWLQSRSRQRLAYGTSDQFMNQHLLVKMRQLGVACRDAGMQRCGDAALAHFN